MADNPQYTRTHRAIIRAFITLLQQNSFEKITVQDILDETPVTRATFYAHFRDKYEIAEIMQDFFLEIRREVRKGLQEGVPFEVLQSRIPFHKDFTAALLKIRTENVDLRQSLANELEQEYLSKTQSPNREMEAKIFAHAYVELYLLIMKKDGTGISPEESLKMMVPVAASLLKLGNDQKTLHFLNDRLAEVMREGKTGGHFPMNL